MKIFENVLENEEICYYLSLLNIMLNVIGKCEIDLFMFSSGFYEIFQTIIM